MGPHEALVAAIRMAIAQAEAALRLSNSSRGLNVTVRDTVKGAGDQVKAANAQVKNAVDAVERAMQMAAAAKKATEEANTLVLAAQKAADEAHSKVAHAKDGVDKGHQTSTAAHAETEKLAQQVAQTLKLEAGRQIGAKARSAVASLDESKGGTGRAQQATGTAMTQAASSNNRLGEAAKALTPVMGGIEQAQGSLAELGKKVSGVGLSLNNAGEQVEAAWQGTNTGAEKAAEGAGRVSGALEMLRKYLRAVTAAP